MFLSRNIKSLETLSQQKQNDGRIEAKLVEIANSLLINYFIPSESNFKPDLFPLILHSILPLMISDISISVRVQAESFLNRLCSLMTSFSPSYILTILDTNSFNQSDGGGNSGYISYGSYSNVPLSKKTTSAAANLMSKIFTLDPTEQSSILLFLAKSLHYIPPSIRSKFIDTCHTLVLNSRPKCLHNLNINDWRLLANSFSVISLPPIVTFLITNGNSSKSKKINISSINNENENTEAVVKIVEDGNYQTPINNDEIDVKIIHAVIIFLERDPQTLLPIILNESSLQLLSQIIPLIPKHIHVPISLIKERISNAIRGAFENASEASCAIELTNLLSQRERFPNENQDWLEIFTEIHQLWSNPKLIISHRAAILDCISSFALHHFISVDSLQPYFVIYQIVSPSTTIDDDNVYEYDFDYQFVAGDDQMKSQNELFRVMPTSLIVSFIKLTSAFILLKEKVPKGFSMFCMRILFERDPLLFVALINLLADCFNVMYKIIPNISTKIINACLNPLPQYFVEQIAVLHLIESIDFEQFTVKKLRYTISDIIKSFIQNPHPSLLNEIKNLIDKLHIILPISELDWFEHIPSILSLLPYSSPYLILELIDANLIPPASYPLAISSLSSTISWFSESNYKSVEICKLPYCFFDKKQVSEFSTEVIQRALYIVFESIKLLKLDFKPVSQLNKQNTSNRWDYISSSLGNLYEMINENLNDTTFGKIIASSLEIIAVTSKYVSFITISKAIDFLKIANIFATSFTVECCQIVSEIARTVEMLNQDASSRPELQNYHNELIKFFSSTFQFDYCVQVSLAAIECLKPEELTILKEYIDQASNLNRIVILMNKASSSSNIFIKNVDGKALIAYYNTFLAFKYDPEMSEYVNKCIYEIPFENWVIEEADSGFINKFKGIKIERFDALDDLHKRIYNLMPNNFTIQEQTEKPETSILFDSIENKINLNSINGIDKLISNISKEVLYDNDVVVLSEDKVNIEPYSPYVGFEASPSILFGFLWNSNRKVTDDEYQKIQNYSLSLNNSKIASAFLAYSSRHHFNLVDIEKWIASIKIDKFDHYSILSFCILTSFIRKKWSELSNNELKFINGTLIELGYHDISPYNIVSIYKEENMISKMVAESIISIDPTLYEEFPLFGDIFTGHENFLKNSKHIISQIPRNIKLEYKPARIRDQSNSSLERYGSQTNLNDGASNQAEAFPIRHAQSVNFSSSDFQKSSESKSFEFEEEDVDESFYNSEVIENDGVPFPLLFELQAIFSRYLSPSVPLSKYEQYSIPHGVPFIDSNYYPVSIELDHFHILNHSNQLRKIKNRLLFIFERSSVCDSFLFYVLFHLGLTESEYQRCVKSLERFTRSHSLYSHIVFSRLSRILQLEIGDAHLSLDTKQPNAKNSQPATPAYTNLLNDNSLFIDGVKTPSMTREFASLLSSPYLPSNITRSDVKIIIKNANFLPVALTLLIKGFEVFSLNLYDKSTPLFQLRDEDYLLLSLSPKKQQFNDSQSSSILTMSHFNLSAARDSSPYIPNETELDTSFYQSLQVVLTPDVLNRLKAHFTTVSKTTSIIAKQFFNMDSATLCKYYNTVSADAALVEISDKLIDAIMNQPTYLIYVVDIIKSLINHAELMQLAMIANSETFLNSKLFICVYLMQEFFEKKVESSAGDEFKEMWKALKSQQSQKIQDQRRLEIFQTKNSLEAFAKIINSDI